VYTVSTFLIKKTSEYNVTDLITMRLLQVPSPATTMRPNTSGGVLNELECRPRSQGLDIVRVGGKFRLKEQIGSGSFGA